MTKQEEYILRNIWFTWIFFTILFHVSLVIPNPLVELILAFVPFSIMTLMAPLSWHMIWLFPLFLIITALIQRFTNNRPLANVIAINLLWLLFFTLGVNEIISLRQ